MIQWYPGHMAKTRRMLQERLRLVDVVVEVADARLPVSSRNPELARMVSGKPSVLILNKADLADERETGRWVAFINKTSKTTACVPFDALHDRPAPVISAINAAAEPIVERYKARGMTKTVRAMVVGIPNSGKSALINRLCGKAIAIAQDRPGVTRSPQWVKVGDRLELLDTPGMLWPKLADDEAAKRLACVGTIRDQILQTEELAEYLLRELVAVIPDRLAARYHMDIFTHLQPNVSDIDASEQAGVYLKLVAKGRGFILSGGRLNLERAAAVVLDEFRAGLLGRISLERLEE